MLALRLCTVFTELDERIVRELINRLTIKSIPANSLLLQQHVQADDMCFVINGQFQLSKTNSEHQTEVINLIGRGDTVGEIDLICGNSRTADVKTVRNSTVAYLNRDAFEYLLKQYPLDINQTIARSIIEHLDRALGITPITAETFTLINLAPQFDIQAFFQSLRIWSEITYRISRS